MFFEKTVAGHKISDIALPANEVVIDDVVLNTMSDMSRIMAYHPVEKPTRYKYAAYLGFWWQRGKPFSCKLQNYSEFPEIEDGLLNSIFRDLCMSLNELFIADVMLSMIKLYPTEDVCADITSTFTRIQLKESLLYFLKYRQYTAQGLELFLKGLGTCPTAF
jgi:hypothetical protein